jgi:hypothetical protein
MKPEWAKRRADPYMIDLTDEQLGSVTLYVQWLYTGDLHAQVNLEKGASIKTRAEENERMSEILVKAFILGDKLFDKDFQTVILQKWIDTHIITEWTCGDPHSALQQNVAWIAGQTARCSLRGVQRL